MTSILLAGLRSSFVTCVLLLASLFWPSSAQAGVSVAYYTLPTVVANQIYSFDLSSLAKPASYGSTFFRRVNGFLPTGLSFTDGNSVIRGTPTVAGSYSNAFLVTALNGSSGFDAWGESLSFNVLASASAGTNVLANTLSNGIIFTGGTLTNVNGYTSSASITLGSGGVAIDTSGGTGTYSGLISGVGDLRVNAGSGTVVLTRVNAYSSATSIGAGSTLALAGAGSIAASGGLSDNGTLDISAANIASNIASLSGSGAITLGSKMLYLTNAGGTFSGGIAGSGGVVVLGGTETLSGSNFYTGITGVSAGATLALSGAGSIASSSYLEANGTLDISNASTGAAIKGLSGTGAVLLGANNLTISSSSNVFSGAISGSGGLTIAGGQQYLAGLNTYTGITSIDSGGTLILLNAGAIASSSELIINGTFSTQIANNAVTVRSISGSGSVLLGSTGLTISNANGTFSGSIGGLSGLTIAAGRQTLASTNYYLGDTTIAAGATLALSGNGLVYGAIINNGTFDISATSNGTEVRGISGNGSIALGAQTLTLTSVNSSVGGAISGTGGLLISNGTQTLTGANTYTGATAVLSGATLVLSGSGSIAASSGVGNDGTLDISNTTSGASIASLFGSGITTLGSKTLSLTNASGNYSGYIVGTGSVAILGGVQRFSGSNSFTGTTTIASGSTLVLSGSGVLSRSSNILNNGIFDLSGSYASQLLKSLSGAGATTLGQIDLGLSNASGNYSGAISGTGGLGIWAGSETLSGNNIYTGATQIATGSALILSGLGAIASSRFLSNSGTFDISGTTNGATIQKLYGNGAITLGAKNLTVSNGDGVFSGVISGSGGLTISGGVQYLAGANAYSGATSIDSGATLMLLEAGTIAASSGLVNNGSFNIALLTNGATVQSISGSGTVSLGSQNLTVLNARGAIGGAITGAGGLIIAGGTQTLSGVNTYYNGTISVAAGATLALSGAGANESHVVLLNSGIVDISATANNASVKAISGSGSVALGAQNLTVTIASGILSGVITGSGGLTITSGTQTLSGVNTYTGVTQTVFGATLALSGSGSINSSTTLLNNGNFDISSTTNGATVQALIGTGSVTLGTKNLTVSDASGTFRGVTTGSGGFSITGGVQTLAGAMLYTGATSISSGATLALGGTTLSLSSGVNNNGTFDISRNSGTLINDLSGNGTVALGANSLYLRNANGTFSGVIGGTGGLSLWGGSKTLSETNTYTGATSLDPGSTLVLSGRGAIAESSGVSNNGILDISATTSGASIKSLSGSGTTILGSKTLTLANAGDDFNGSISGAGGLTISGGIETLSGNNTYTGATTIAAGATLVLSGSGSIATSTAISNSGTLDISAATSASPIGVAISGTGGLTISGGALTLSGANTYSGATQVNGGTLNLVGSVASTQVTVAGGALVDTNGGLATATNLTVNGGTVSFDSNQTVANLNGLGGTVGVASGSALTINNGGSYAGTLSGGGSVIIAGGLETLTGSSTMTGNIQVNSGAQLTINSGAALGSGSLALVGSATVPAVLSVSSSTTISNPISVVADPTFNIANGTTTTVSSPITDGFASGEIVVNGGGTLLLQGVNTYTGATLIENDGSTLALSGAGSIATSSGVSNNGNFDIGATTSGALIKSLAGSGTTTLGSQTLTLTNAGDTYGGVIVGAGGLTVSGGVETLSGADTYTGATSIGSGASLALSGDGSISMSSEVSNNGTFDISGTSAGTSISRLSGSGRTTLGSKTLTLTNASGNFSGAIQGSGGLTVAGGTQTLSGTNTYTGATTIGSGAALTLSGSGSISNSASVVNNGSLNVTSFNGNVRLGGNFTQSSTGTLAMTLSPVDTQKVNVNGTASLDGVLSLTSLGNSRTGKYTLLTASSINGVFSSLSTDLASYSNVGIALTYDNSDVYLLLTPNVANTQASLQQLADNLPAVYRLQTSAVKNGLTYDCDVFDENRFCLSTGGRYTQENTGINSNNALLIGAYKLDEQVKLGAYLDQGLNSNNIGSGISVSNGNPLLGVFGAWNEQADQLGYSMRFAAGYGERDVSMTRGVIGSSEPGSGTSKLTSQAASITGAYAFPVNEQWTTGLYAGVRYTKISLGAYSEQQTNTVTAPLAFDSLAEETTTGFIGILLNGNVLSNFDLSGSLGVEQDINHNMDSYSATGLAGLTPISMISSTLKTRPVANLAASYQIDKTQKISLKAIYRQEALQSINSWTSLVTYTAGF